MKKGFWLAVAAVAAFGISHYIPMQFLAQMLQFLGACLITMACVEITRASRK